MLLVSGHISFHCMVESAFLLQCSHQSYPHSLIHGHICIVWECTALLDR